jgi:hypothetical protein
MAPPTILVPLDLGREGDRALPIGRALADRTGGRLEVVVITDTDDAAGMASDEREVRAHARRAEARARCWPASTAGRARRPCRVARTWAERLGSKVRVVQVEDDHDGAGGARAAAVAAAAIQADGVLAGWDAVAARSPAAGILAAAAGMDDPLIVVGSRSAPPEGFAAGTLHHVVRAVVAASPHPVLVARA